MGVELLVVDVSLIVKEFESQKIPSRAIPPSSEPACGKYGAFEHL